MTGIEKPTGRLVALIVLLALVGVALRGYLPGDQRGPRQQPAGNPAVMYAVVAVITVAVVIIAIAIIAALREPQKPPDPAMLRLSEALDGERGRPRWRLLLIALAVIIVWLAVFVVLLRLIGPHQIAQPSPTTGSSAAPPSAAPAPPPARSPTPTKSEGDVFWVLFANTAALVLLLMIAGLITVVRRRRLRVRNVAVSADDSAPSPVPSGPQTLAVAAERGLAEIEDLSREPREAIIACYAAMERALADAPEAVPQESDTPSEVLARAVDHRAIHPDSATELVDLFAEARFSVHVMNEEHREVAVRALQLVLAELRSVA